MVPDTRPDAMTISSISSIVGRSSSRSLAIVADHSSHAVRVAEPHHGDKAVTLRKARKIAVEVEPCRDSSMIVR
jgi:hypothetical protein